MTAVAPAMTRETLIRKKRLRGLNYSNNRLRLKDRPCHLVNSRVLWVKVKVTPMTSWTKSSKWWNNASRITIWTGRLNFTMTAVLSSQILSKFSMKFPRNKRLNSNRRYGTPTFFCRIPTANRYVLLKLQNHFKKKKKYNLEIRGSNKSSSN